MIVMPRGTLIDARLRNSVQPYLKLERTAPITESIQSQSEVNEASEEV
jgi:hypothetical protein